MISHPGKERGEGVGEMSGEFGMIDNPIRGEDRVRNGVEMSDGCSSFGGQCRACHAYLVLMGSTVTLQVQARAILSICVIF